ncbi:MAG: phosphoadenosine phosphosulfate reductase family protein [Mariniphaga sp.]|nr:phosphoadenosine phosphosulfate reductase family protein [Paludibacter sp.]MDD4226004.1 phosphoadenosine phosphosulfate reductase family protein [Mariniphaga sp.]
MILQTKEILSKLYSLTNSVILFHSATGKDSIVLLDLLYKKGLIVQPVFMYEVKGLTYIEKYIAWSEKKYNVKFIQVPHFSLSSFIKTGALGIKKDAKFPIMNISKISKSIYNKTGIEWVVMGCKCNDSLVRNAQLKTYELNSIYQKGKKCYPLSEWNNKECLNYIKLNHLITPIKTNNRKSQGNITCIDDLKWLHKNYPNDLQKVFNQFPECEAMFYQSNYENK